MANKKFTPPYILKVCDCDGTSYSLPLAYAEDLDPYAFLSDVSCVKLSTLMGTSAIIDYEHDVIIKSENLNPTMNTYLTGSSLYKNFVYFNVPYDKVDDFFYNLKLFLSNLNCCLASECDLSSLVSFCQRSRFPR